jgi:hypothetical protein
MSTRVSAHAELTLDVSASLPFDEPSHVAASIHLPEAPRAALICWPGGSYGRAYWDMQIPGHPGYSFAEHMTARAASLQTATGSASRP